MTKGQQHALATYDGSAVAGGMSRRAIGLALLNVTGVLVIAGSLYDLLVPSVPSNHLAYLGAGQGEHDPRYADLDLAIPRSIGGCLLPIGATAQVLANGPIRRRRCTGNERRETEQEPTREP